MEKVRTTFYLDKKLIELAHLEVNNISELVGNLLETYLSTNGLESIEKKILEHEKKLDLLKQKKAQLIKQGFKENKMEGMVKKIWEDMFRIFEQRKRNYDNQQAHEVWITSKKNLQRCKILNMEPLEVLAKLQEK